MGLEDRLRRLEQQPVSETELWERAHALAREHDLPFEDVLAEAQRFLRMTPAQQAEALAELRAGIADLDRDRLAAECAQHGGPACWEWLR